MARESGPTYVLLLYCIIRILRGHRTESSLTLDLHIMIVVLDLEKRLGGIINPPDYYRSDIDWVRVDVIDLQFVRLEVVDPH